MTHGLVKITEVLDQHAKAGERLYVTLLTPMGQAMTFADDNWRFLPSLVKELIGRGKDGDGYSVVVRRFDEKPARGKIPFKTVAGFLAHREGIIALSEQAMRDAHETDNQTGKRIPAEAKVRYADGLSLLPELRPFATVIDGGDEEDGE